MSAAFWSDLGPDFEADVQEIVFGLIVLALLFAAALALRFYAKWKARRAVTVAHGDEASRG